MIPVRTSPSTNSITRNGTDFAIGNVAAEKGGRSFLGTPEFMSPEQWAESKGNKPTVFISYRRDEAAMAARVLATGLESNGVSVFLDTERVDTVVPFPEELERAIGKSDIFLCLLGEKTLASLWVPEEIRIAWQLKKPMIPVFQESFRELKLPESLPEHTASLLRHQGVELLDRRGIYIDPAIEKLAKMIHSFGARPRTVKTAFGASPGVRNQ